MRTIIKRCGKGLVALAPIAVLTACTLGREPAYDSAIADEVTGLTAATLRLFQDFKPGVTSAHADREPQYRAIASRAETVRLMAQARGSAAPAGGLAQQAARLGANLSLIEKVST